jgi:hypothetical protein
MCSGTSTACPADVGVACDAGVLDAPADAAPGAPPDAAPDAAIDAAIDAAVDAGGGPDAAVDTTDAGAVVVDAQPGPDAGTEPPPGDGCGCASGTGTAPDGLLWLGVLACLRRRRRFTSAACTPS